MKLWLRSVRKNTLIFRFLVRTRFVSLSEATNQIIGTDATAFNTKVPPSTKVPQEYCCVHCCYCTSIRIGAHTHRPSVRIAGCFVRSPRRKGPRRYTGHSNTNYSIQYCNAVSVRGFVWHMFLMSHHHPLTGVNRMVRREAKVFLRCGIDNKLKCYFLFTVSFSPTLLELYSALRKRDACRQCARLRAISSLHY